ADVPARGRSDGAMKGLLAASQERKCSVFAGDEKSRGTGHVPGQNTPVHRDLCRFHRADPIWSGRRGGAISLTHEATRPRLLRRGARAFVRTRAVPLLGWVRGGFTSARRGFVSEKSRSVPLSRGDGVRTPPPH